MDEQINQTQPTQTQDEQKDTTIENFDPNVLAALSYVLAPITGIVIYLLEKKNNFVRYHALQSTFFGLAYWCIRMIFSTDYFGFGGSFVIYLYRMIFNTILPTVYFVLWLILIWKSYKNELYQLPVIGKIAKDQVFKQK